MANRRVRVVPIITEEQLARVERVAQLLATAAAMIEASAAELDSSLRVLTGENCPDGWQPPTVVYRGGRANTTQTFTPFPDEPCAD